MTNAASKPQASLADIDRKPMRIVRLIRLLSAGGAAYAIYKTQWKKVLTNYFTGPGRLSRILMLIFALLNLKNMPFVWTYRLWHAIFFHNFIQKAPVLGPRALFRPMISESHAPIMEIDYNIHKSNSTYFSDLDIARTHMASYLLRTGLRKLDNNLATGLVLDDVTGKPRRGRFGIMLGAVHCSFRREILGYRGYEMWTRVLAWDRKWLYMVTHFVPKGVARPAEYLDTRFGKLRTRTGGADANTVWKSKIHATAVSKYVFKLGRWTVHPAHILEGSELLPERPGGWRSGPNQVGDEADLGEVADDAGWDWKMVEKRRRAGMEFAQQFANLDQLETWFDGADGGDGSALGRFGLQKETWF
ncbi:hypothetical protein B0T11DRAFT_330512 [Plectosphaerella cucumerina]|uniref:Capsule polysaccharide biosynthesis protein n=1 Tax=Plectosphaerella cucumerina TaxID=40658 RepID=A0A8K0TBX3_9PEZI|nr:hypothetical protein B0T11DRAFT_330512 [Plectosphaerella cucumerina]